MGKKRTLNELRQTKDAHYIPKYDPQTGDKNPYYKELTGEDEPVFYDDEDPIMMGMQIIKLMHLQEFNL